MRIPQWSVAFLQRDRKFSISALTQSTAESVDNCGKCEWALNTFASLTSYGVPPNFRVCLTIEHCISGETLFITSPHPPILGAYLTMKKRIRNGGIMYRSSVRLYLQWSLMFNSFFHLDRSNRWRRFQRGRNSFAISEDVQRFALYKVAKIRIPQVRPFHNDRFP